MPTEGDMFPNNYGHTGSDDGYAPLTSAQNHVQNDTLRQSPALPACRLVGAQIDRSGDLSTTTAADSRQNGRRME
jgi:hypothetical protein